MFFYSFVNSILAMKSTPENYNKTILICRSLFEKKMYDYGAAWRILRLPSLTDQIYIKAKRIRTLQETETSKIQENENSEFIGIINYCIMSLIQIKLGVSQTPDLSLKEALTNYDLHVKETFELMLQKNHDYNEAWRNLRISSLTDFIIQKLLRLKQIESNNGYTLVSEGEKTNYQDIINYSVFALILKNEY